jgi:UDP-GlcNAc3NAcA epimerase
MKKIVTILGARPQFVKAAPVSKAFLEHGEFTEVMVHTGQHYDHKLSDVFFLELEIPKPKYNLGVGSSSHGVQTGEMLKLLDDILINEKPDMVLVYGDTNSTLAGALSAAKLHIKVAHVEAGLRSFNKAMPEEINRIVTDHLSDILFAPTSVSVANLKTEGIVNGVYKTGDVMYDAVLTYSEKAKKNSSILKKLSISDKPYILTTIHRAENTDDPKRLANICEALSNASKNCRVIMPLHPRTAKFISQTGINLEKSGITIIEPVGFLDMIALECSARLIVTDSGGVQKEAYFHKVPCVTLRTETEWVETIQAGWNTLADTSSIQSITSAIEAGLNNKKDRSNIDEYGDGNAAKDIVKKIMEYI